MHAHFSFAGRLSRREYWLSYLLLLGLGIAFGVGCALFLVLASALSLGKLFALVWLGAGFLAFGVATTWVSVASLVKRIHDVGHSGWWVLACSVPLVGLVVWLYFGLAAGVAEANRWGPAPSAIRPVAA